MNRKAAPLAVDVMTFAFLLALATAIVAVEAAGDVIGWLAVAVSRLIVGRPGRAAVVGAPRSVPTKPVRRPPSSVPERE